MPEGVIRVNNFNIELKITERDKKIIKYFGMFLIVVGFVFLVIKPCFDKAIEYSDQKAELELQLDEMQNKIDNKVNLENQLQNNKITFNNNSKNYYNLMSNQEIDNMITTLFRTYGLTARDLSISTDEQTASLNNYNQGKDEETADASYSSIYVSKITVKSDGSVDNFKALIDYIYDNMNGVLVESYSISSATSNNTTSTTLNLSIDLYMVSKE